MTTQQLSQLHEEPIPISMIVTTRAVSIEEIERTW